MRFFTVALASACILSFRRAAALQWVCGMTLDFLLPKTNKKQKQKANVLGQSISLQDLMNGHYVIVLLLASFSDSLTLLLLQASRFARWAKSATAQRRVDSRNVLDFTYSGHFRKV
jgi:hypothetical protein